MQTQCPSCSAVLDVTEEILSVANGKVRCGDCGQVFDGNEHLKEKDVPPQPISASETATPENIISEPTLDELDNIEAELFSLEQDFEATGAHIEKFSDALEPVKKAEATTPPAPVTNENKTPGKSPEPSIDISFKATSPNTDAPVQHTVQNVDVDLSKKITSSQDAPQTAKHAEQKAQSRKPKPIEPKTPEIDLPEIDLALDESQQNPEAFGVDIEEVMASDSSIDDIISKFMADNQGEPSNTMDPEASHAIEIDEMIAESGIIVDVQDSDASFKELMDEINQDATPTPSGHNGHDSKAEALDHALSDHATVDDDIFAGLTGVNLDDALSTRATDEAIKALFPVREESPKDTAPQPEPELKVAPKSEDIDKGVDELFGLDNSDQKDPGSLLPPQPKKVKKEPKKTKKKLGALGLAGCALLMLAFCAQAFYAARHTLADNPATANMTVQACKYLPFCELRKPEAYKLISRDITPHPVLKDIQVLDIKLINQAKFEQPLPYVFVSMTDQMGKQVATNTFKNSEYEEDNVWVKAGEERTIQILFRTPNSRAKNFEIGFQ